MLLKCTTKLKQNGRSCGNAAISQMSLCLLHEYVSTVGNLEMAEFDGHSDDELMETAVMAAAGLVIFKAIKRCNG
jgi:hypothetical protein